MFSREMRDVFDVISFCHTKYGKDLTVGELAVLFDDRNPAMPDSTRERAHELIAELSPGNPDNIDLHMDLVNSFGCGIVLADRREGHRDIHWRQ